MDEDHDKDIPEQLLNIEMMIGGASLRRLLVYILENPELFSDIAPNLRSYAKQWRRSAIVREFAEGATVQELSIRHNITSRRVYQIISLNK